MVDVDVGVSDELLKISTLRRSKGCHHVEPGQGATPDVFKPLYLCSNCWGGYQFEKCFKKIAAKRNIGKNYHEANREVNSSQDWEVSGLNDLSSHNGP